MKGDSLIFSNTDQINYQRVYERRWVVAELYLSLGRVLNCVLGSGQGAELYLGLGRVLNCSGSRQGAEVYLHLGRVLNCTWVSAGY
jgi:hypothetical protein